MFNKIAFGLAASLTALSVVGLIYLITIATIEHIRVVKWEARYERMAVCQTESPLRNPDCER
jgi:hypothetical protein